jgi:hypothetical protein
MTAGEHEMPPHLARYVASLSDPGKAADASPRLTIAAGYDADHYLRPASTETVRATAAPEASQPAAHVDPAAAARWHQAQTELAGLIRAENRARAADPHVASVLPGKLGAWMEQRAAELEQAEADQPGIEPPG